MSGNPAWDCNSSDSLKKWQETIGYDCSVLVVSPQTPPLSRCLPRTWRQPWSWGRRWSSPTWSCYSPKNYRLIAHLGTVHCILCSILQPSHCAVCCTHCVQCTVHIVLCTVYCTSCLKYCTLSIVESDDYHQVRCWKKQAFRGCGRGSGKSVCLSVCLSVVAFSWCLRLLILWWAGLSSVRATSLPPGSSCLPPSFPDSSWHLLPFPSPVCWESQVL